MAVKSASRIRKTDTFVHFNGRAKMKKIVIFFGVLLAMTSVFGQMPETDPEAC